jgi:hypothetical protein
MIILFIFVWVCVWVSEQHHKYIYEEKMFTWRKWWIIRVGGLGYNHDDDDDDDEKHFLYKAQWQ